MSKLNQKGFTALEVLLLLVILATIGAIGYFAYTNVRAPQKTSTAESASKKSTSTNQAATQSTVTYTNASLGFTFDYPKDWNVTEDKSGDTLNRVILHSPDYKKIDYQNGTTDTLKGEAITISPAASYSGDSPDQFVGIEKVLLENGTLKLEHGTIGNFTDTVQYSYTDEQPQTFFARLPFRGHSYVQTSLQSEGDETDNAHWVPFTKIVGSIR